MAPGPDTYPLVVIGAGPAGLAVAGTAARLGVRTLVIDEADAPGGQVYRDYPPEFAPKGRFARRKEMRERDALLSAVAASHCVVPQQDAVFWGVDEDRSLLVARGDELVPVRYETLIIAAGAQDRPVPFPGWELPGVLSVGGAYRLVKTQGVLPGGRVLVAGSGPLLLVLAEELIRAGARIVALVESARVSLGPGRVLGLLRVPSMCLEALRLKRVLKRARVEVCEGWGVVEAKGDGGVEEVVCAPFTDAGALDRTRLRTFEVDAVAAGYGLLSRTAAAGLLGCDMLYDAAVNCAIPRRDADLETSVEGVYAAGDGARVAGKLVAREEGKLAALAAAKRLGAVNVERFQRDARPVRRKLARLYRWRRTIDEIYRLPEGLFDVVTDDTIVCRCEEVTAREILDAAEEGTLDLNDIKRRVRAGSGWCQGRTCGSAIVEILARRRGVSQEEVLRMTGRPPVKPIPLSMVGGEGEGCRPETGGGRPAVGPDG